MTERQLTLRWKNFERKRQSYERKYSNASKRAISVQIKEGVEIVKRSGTLNAALNNVQNISIEPVNLLYNELYAEVGLDFAQAQIRSLKEQASELITKDLASDFAIGWSATVSDYVAEKLTPTLINVTDTTISFLQASIKKGIEEGLSIDKTAALIVDEWEEVSEARAVRIARTEIISASNYGSLQGAEATGLEFSKTWIATRDNRTREAHKADIKNVPKDGAFNVMNERLLFPGDRSLGASAKNVVNCRCAIGYDFEESKSLKVNNSTTFTNYPQSATNAAKKVLKWVKENGWGSCGTDVGKQRANQLANREPISFKTIKRTFSYLSRAEEWADVPYSEGCGGLMYDAWGGKSMKKWCKRIIEEND